MIVAFVIQSFLIARRRILFLMAALPLTSVREDPSLALACHDSLKISLTRRKRSTHSFHQSRVSMTHGSSGSVSNRPTILSKKVLLSNFSSMGNHLSQELRATRAWRVFSSKVYIAISEHHTYLNRYIGDGPTCQLPLRDYGRFSTAFCLQYRVYTDCSLRNSTLIRRPVIISSTIIYLL
jgi:hypothetical protein